VSDILSKEQVRSINMKYPNAVSVLGGIFTTRWGISVLLMLQKGPKIVYPQFFSFYFVCRLNYKIADWNVSEAGFCSRFQT
jgi:hypothetical protein